MSEENVIDEEVKSGPEPSELEGFDELVAFAADEDYVETKEEAKEEVNLPDVPETSNERDSLQSDNKDETVKEDEETPEQTIERMRQTILELTSGTKLETTSVKNEATKEESKVDVKDTQVWPEQQFDLSQLITDEELDQMIDKPEVVREALNRVRLATLNEAGRILPDIIRQEVNMQVTVGRLVTDFYDSNRDLIPYADYVSHVMRGEEQKNPNKSYREIFETVAQESRKKLGLKKITESNPSSTDESPAFAGKKRNAGRPLQQPVGQAGDLAEMMTMRDHF